MGSHYYCRKLIKKALMLLVALLVLSLIGADSSFFLESKMNTLLDKAKPQKITSNRQQSNIHFMEVSGDSKKLDEMCIRKMLGLRGGSSNCPFICGMMSLNRNPFVQWLFPALGWVGISFYHLLTDKLYDSQISWRMQQARAKALWAVQICESGNSILGVQTLRNTLTAVGFLATTTTGVLSLIVTLAYSHSDWPVIRILRYASTILLLASSAFSFIQSTRYLNHVSFLFSVANDPREPSISPKTVAHMMIQQSHFWWLGLRLMYLSFPSIMWITAGPIAMLLASLLLIYVLNVKDAAWSENDDEFAAVGLNEAIFLKPEEKRSC